MAVCKCEFSEATVTAAYSAAKKYPLKLFAIFLATAQNLCAKFYTLITSSHLHEKAKQHSIFFYCCKLMNFIVRQREFIHIRKLSPVMSKAYWKQPGPSCCKCRRSKVHIINKVCTVFFCTLLVVFCIYWHFLTKTESRLLSQTDTADDLGNLSSTRLLKA